MSDLYCHTCRMTVVPSKAVADAGFVIGYHERHMIEVVPEGEQPFLTPEPFRIWAVCNVWDCADFWQYSLMSLRDHVDGFIILSGPYTDSVPQEEEIDSAMLRAYERYIPSDKLLDWQYRSRWDSHMAKRQAGFESPILRSGDWLLVIDDDEILVSQGKLRNYLQYYPGLLMSLHDGEDRAFKDSLDQMSVIKERLLGATGALSLPQMYQSVKQPQDVTFRTRLFRWEPGTNYAENHWTIRREDGTKVVGETKLWDVSILHARALRPLQEKMKQLQYYSQRQETEEDKPTKHDDMYTGF